MSVLILASESAVRARLLRDAGVSFEVRPSGLDEAEVKASLLAEKRDPAAVADALAQFKAVRVSRAHPEALVLGCDQTLAFDDRLIDKPANLAEARTRLRQLRGKRHDLLTAAVLAKGGAPVWRRLERCSLWMRLFGDEFLDGYFLAEGDKVLGSVGCYFLEGRGIQLFERVEGDYFSILGLPLVPLLAALREHGIVAR
ncbi:MAG: Maf family protein [Alphaproteobacteria bacterium]|nr:Maf family protein [Alphaproteobacteria bacterium]MDE2629664.1 Maf family protein [Alphaproteobacteria bacterium]